MTVIARQRLENLPVDHAFWPRVGGVVADWLASVSAAPRDAVMLRQWDDFAKQAGLATPSLAHFLSRAERCALPQAAPVSV